MSAVAPQRVRVAGHSMALTRHAVERYVERVKPHLTFAQALAELERLLPMAGVFVDRPEWVGSQHTESVWVQLSDGIVFPAARDRLMTCLDRAAVGAQLRIVKSAGSGRAKRDPRPRQSGLRKKQHGKVARDERRRARVAREAMGDG